MKDRLSELYDQRDQRLHKLYEHLAVQFGYGSFSTLGRSLRDRVLDQAESCIEDWEEEPEMQTDPPTDLSTVRIVPRVSGKPAAMSPKLQQLLRELHDSEEAILDLRDP